MSPRGALALLSLSASLPFAVATPTRASPPLDDAALEEARDAAIFGARGGELTLSVVGDVGWSTRTAGAARPGWAFGAMLSVPFDRLALAAGRGPPSTRIAAELKTLDLSSLLEDAMHAQLSRDDFGGRPMRLTRGPRAIVGALAVGELVSLAFAEDASASERRARASGASSIAAPSGSTGASSLAPSLAPSLASASSMRPALTLAPHSSGAIVAARALPAGAASTQVTARASPRVTPASVLRGLVASAWREARLSDDDALDALAARARQSAAFPELRLRVHRGVGIAARLETGQAISDRAFASETAQTLYEARLTWHLDRLVFADEEIALERVRLDRAELRQRIGGRVIELFFNWLRAQHGLLDPDATPFERAQAELLATEAAAALDAYTGGSAAHALAALAPVGAQSTHADDVP